MTAIGAVLSLVIVAAGVGWLAGRRVKSPADAAANRKAPTASLITVPVEERVLSSSVTTRGTIKFEQPTAVSLAGSVGGDGSGGGATQVTKAPAVGSELNDGLVAVEIGGRPVFSFAGALPMYRAITPGMSGRDVEQLEAALARVGIDPGPLDGIYDEVTVRGVELLYFNAGYSAQGPSKEQREQLRVLRRSASDAVDNARAAQKRLDEAAKGVTGVALLELQNAVTEAEQGVNAAQASADREIASAQAEIAGKQRALTDARSAKAAADDLAARARASGVDPVNPPDPCGASCLARLDADVLARVSAIAAADADIAVANTGLVSAQRNAERTVTQAKNAVDVARQRLADARNPTDLTALQRDRDTANTASVTAANELKTLESTVGVSVPAGEILFLPSLPARVSDVKVKPGDAVSAAFMTVSGSTLVVDSSVATADINNVKPNAAVEIRLTEIGRKLTGKITEIAEKPGTKGADARAVYIGITPDDLALATEFAGASVAVVIPLESTGGAVLAVPVAAVTTKADGSTSVQVASGTTAKASDAETVRVKTGLSAGGFVQVEAIAGAKLNRGDRVVIGTR
jgi:hypothetical protein